MPEWLQGQRPPMILKQDSHALCLLHGGAHLSGMEKEIEKLVRLGSIAEVDEAVEEKGNMVISIMFPVPKPDGRTRPVINLQTINTYVRSIRFKMEGLRTYSEKTGGWSRSIWPTPFTTFLSTHALSATSVSAGRHTCTNG